MESRDIENRIEWIHSRKELDDIQKSYIRFQMLEQNKQLLDEIDELKSKLILSEEKVKLNYNCIIDQQTKVKDDKISELEKLYSISDNKIAILNNENQQLQSRISELENDNIDCAHEKTVFRHIRCTACVDCGHLVEIDV